MGLSATLLVADWLLFVRPGITAVGLVPCDFLLFADLSHRLALGQAPYVDFAAPFGWLSMWLLRVGFLMQGRFAGAPEAADMLMLAALLPLACVMLARRVPIGLAAAFILFIFGMVAAPAWLGFVGQATDPGLHYNHWGWALLATLMLAGLPGGQGGRRWLVDGLAIGALLSILFFVKATHWVAGTAFVLLFGVALGDFRKSSAVGLALFAFCVASVHAAGGWVDDYVRNLLDALATAQGPLLLDSGGFRPISMLDTLFAGRADASILVLVLAAMTAWGACSIRMALHGLFALAVCLAVMTQNTLEPNFMGVLSAFFIRLAVESPGEFKVRALAATALALHLVPSFIRQGAAAAAFVGALAGGGGVWLPADLPRMEGVWLAHKPSAPVNALDDAVRRSGMDSAFTWARSHRGDVFRPGLSPVEYAASLRRALALLDIAGASKERIANLDYVNPFPTLLDAPPPRGVLCCLHVNRHLSPANAGDAATILGDAQWLLVPRLPYLRDTTAVLRETLAAHLDEEWEAAASNDLWTLLRRRESQ